jgi:glycosyltransferase involved in cell wall biosynthesis
MADGPLITLGIPAYGRGAFLREALKSCLRQNYGRVEILVADDASSDNPWAAIADLADERWSFVRHTKNLGGPGNFNYLIQQARGELFILHQDDDLLHPEFCSRAAEAFVQHPEAAFYSGLMIRGPEPHGVMGSDLKTFTGPWMPLDYLKGGAARIESLDALCMLLFQIPFMHPAIAMRKDILAQTGGYFDEFMFASDHITLGKMLRYGPALYDTRLSGYFRVHGKNASTSLDLRRQYACRRRVVEILLPEIKQLSEAWGERLTELAGNLPRRERWKVLAEALEAGFPEELTLPIARAISKRPEAAMLRAKLFKARWSYQFSSR